MAGFQARRRFYTALDYDQIARETDFFSDGDAKVIFAKRLYVRASQAAPRPPYSHFSWPHGPRRCSGT